MKTSSLFIAAIKTPSWLTCAAVYPLIETLHARWLFLENFTEWWEVDASPSVLTPLHGCLEDVSVLPAHVWVCVCVCVCAFMWVLRNPLVAQWTHECIFYAYMCVCVCNGYSGLQDQGLLSSECWPGGRLACLSPCLPICLWAQLGEVWGEGWGARQMCSH